MRKWLSVSIFSAVALCLGASAHAEHLVRSYGAPSLLVDKLNQYLNLGKRLDAVAVDDAGHWVLVAETYRYFSHATHFTNNGLKKTIETTLAAGKQVRAIEFDRDGDWLLVGDGVLETNDPVEFNRYGLMNNLRARMNAGATVTVLGRDRATGAFGFVANGFHYAGGLSTRISEAFGDARLSKRVVTDLAVSGDRFILATFGRTIGFNIENTMQGIRTKGLEVEKALLLGTKGYVLAASDRRPALTPAQADADRFERSFSSTAPAGFAPTLENTMRTLGVPGAVIARYKDGQVLWTRGYGVLEKGTERFTQNDSIFPAASMSKLVAGILGARLHELGVIDLDEPLVDLVGDSDDGPFSNWWNTVVDPEWLDSFGAYYAVARSIRAKSARMTARQLLQNMAGLDVHGIGHYPTDTQPTIDDVLLGEGDVDDSVFMIHSPGTVYDYSGGGFTAFEAMLEERLNLAYETLAKTFVLSPAGLSSAVTSFGPPAYEDNAAIGTDPDGTSRGELEDCPGKAAGGLVTTAGEYIKLLIALRNAATGESWSPFSENVARTVLSTALVYPDPNNIQTCAGFQTCGGNGVGCWATASNQTKVCSTFPRNFDSLQNMSIFYGLGARLDGTIGTGELPDSFFHGGSQQGYRTHFRMTASGPGNGYVLFTNADHCHASDAPCATDGGALIDAVDLAMQQLWEP